MDDHQRQARRTDVLLCAGVDHAELLDRHRPRQDVRGHVGHQRHAGAGDTLGGNLDAVDGFVGADVQVGGERIEADFLGRRQAGELALLGRGGDADIAKALRLLDRLLRPGTGDDVIRRTPRQQVHRDLRELLRRPALQEQHLVLLGDAHQIAQVGFRLLEDGHEFLAAMAHFHDAATRAVPVQQLGLRLQQHFFRQRRRSGAEIPDPPHQASPLSLLSDASEF